MSDDEPDLETKPLFAWRITAPDGSTFVKLAHRANVQTDMLSLAGSKPDRLTLYRENFGIIASYVGNYGVELIEEGPDE